MRPLFNKESLWVYPIYAGAGASFGYWLMGVEQRQFKVLTDRREALLEKRRRAAQRDQVNMGTPAQVEEEGIHATP